jgi:hypothetical protein
MQTRVGKEGYLTKLKVVVISSAVILTVRGNFFRMFERFLKRFTRKRA